MELGKHILYQKIIAHHKAFPGICQVFERELVEKYGWDVQQEKAHSQELALAHSDSEYPQDYYNALLLAAFFNKFYEADVLEYINLARKEILAYNILEHLNLTRESPERLQNILHDFCAIPLGKLYVPPTVTLSIRVDLISQFISDHLPYLGIAKNYITMRDVESVLERSIGSVSGHGLVGGKSAGMLLARHILLPTLAEPEAELAESLAEPDSFFLKSCISAGYVSRNNLQECHSLKYLDNEQFEETRSKLLPRFMNGSFSEKTIEKFREILLKTAGSPLIIRSSSYLEDGVDCSFSGKYDSFFISNHGTMAERLAELMRAIKQVYFSLYSMQVIQYRRDKNLLDYNERMAVLIQKVVGRSYGKYYFPFLGIVGFSKNSYCWSNRLNPADGMLRLVFGLGTRAVDRVGDDYPRLVSLSEPTLRPEVTVEEQIKYSQRLVDVLNLETKQVETHNFVALYNEIREQGHSLDLRGIVSVVEDGILKEPLFFPERLEHGKCALTFAGLLKDKKFPGLMARVLGKVEDAYGMPVDMEFAYEDKKLYVLQCRHLAQRGSLRDEVVIPEVDEESILFTAANCFASALVKDISYIVYVDTDAYHELKTAAQKQEVARMIGKLNRALAEKRFILLGPGRWGTSNLELGVPVQYHDINNSKMLIEIAREQNGITSEVSCGTHFFQDLVEADIVPLPLYPDEEGIIFRRDFLLSATNAAAKIIPDFDPSSIVKVIDVKRETDCLLHFYLDDKEMRGAGVLE